MFSCKDSIQLLLEFLDGEMTPEDQAHLEEHLSGCPPCLEFVRSYRATPGMCKRAMAAKMPQELADKLQEYIRARLRKPS